MPIDAQLIFRAQIATFPGDKYVGHGGRFEPIPNSLDEAPLHVQRGCFAAALVCARSAGQPDPPRPLQITQEDQNDIVRRLQVAGLIAL